MRTVYKRDSKEQILAAPYSMTARSLETSCFLDLGREKRTFTDCESMKDCMLAIADVLINDNNNDTVICANVTLSDT